MKFRHMTTPLHHHLLLPPAWAANSAHKSSGISMLKMQKNAIKWYIAALGCKSEVATALFQSNVPSASSRSVLLKDARTLLGFCSGGRVLREMELTVNLSKSHFQCR